MIIFPIVLNGMEACKRELRRKNGVILLPRLQLDLQAYLTYILVDTVRNEEVLRRMNTNMELLYVTQDTKLE